MIARPETVRRVRVRRLMQAVLSRSRDRGFIMLLGARSLQMANGFLISISLLWRFGLPSIGSYAVASLPLAIIALVTSLGLVNALPRQKLSQPQRATAGLMITAVLLLPALAFAIAYGRWIAIRPAEATTIAAFAFGGYFIGQANVLQTLYIMQKRAGASLIPQIAATIGIGCAAFFCRSPAHFALVVLAARGIGNLLGLAALRYGRISSAEFVAAATAGTSFAPVDVVAMMSEQLPILVLTAVLTRGEMGIIGLARQIVSAADTPGWSFMQAKYPEIVDTRMVGASAIARNNARLAMLVGALALLGSTVLGFLVYRQPVLVAAMAILLATLPARYMNHLCDQMLRAGGWIRDSMGLALSKLALSLILTYALAAPFGLWGAIMASAILSMVFGLIYRWRFVTLAPGILPPLRRRFA